MFNKPVIYADTSYDRSPYDSWFVDDPLWTFETLKKIGTPLTKDNIHNVKALIDEGLSSTVQAAARDQARAESWANIGSSASLTVDYLMDKHDQLMAQKAEQAAV